MMKNPCSAPHAINAVVAPCHNPVAKKTIARFKYVRAFPFRFSAKRYVEVIPKPAAQGNMPSAPEFRRILRTERLSEVFWKADTKQLSTSYNDIHTTGEFHIKLNHITNRCRKNHCSMIVCIMVKHLIYHQCHTVCYHHLFKESPEDSYITIDHISIFQWLSCIQSTCLHLNILRLVPPCICGKNPRNNAVLQISVSAWMVPQYTSVI